MAINFSKSSALNDDLWNEWSDQLVAVMQDTDNEKTDADKVVNSLFNVKKSTKFGEKATGMTEFADFSVTAEGAAAEQDELQEAFPKLITHTAFMKKFVCTADMAEDAAIDVMRVKAANYVKSYKRTRANWATAALCGEGATFAFGGKTYDRTTGDSKALFAVDHPGKRTGVAAQSNVFTNAFGDDDAMLNRLANIGRNFRNASGHVMGYTFDTIVIPGNCYRLEALAKKICNSDQQVGSNYNDVNVNKGIWKLIVNPFWQAEEGAEPYILMSSAANKEMLGNVFYDRIPLTMRDHIDIDTHNLEWSGRFRCSAGFYGWQHVLMGGAKTGTTLA